MSRTRTVRVLPDIRGLARRFDYTVPPELNARVRVGTIVRFDLHGRRMRGWVVDEPVAENAGESGELKPLLKVTGWGPPAEVVALSSWAAWRWAGPPSAFLNTASPQRAVTELPPGADPGGRVDIARVSPVGRRQADLVTKAISEGARSCVLRLPPDSEVASTVAALVAYLGPLLILVPEQGAAIRLGAALSRVGEQVAVMPEDWPAARAGNCTVVGTRSAAWAPCEPLCGVLVLDEHDESYAQTQTPTWHAREVAGERARRAGVPCVMTSPTPSLEALAGSVLVSPGRATERGGWPVLEVIDQRVEDPLRSGLVSEPLVELLRAGGQSLCVLNRKGRARLLACSGCQEVARCERCDAAVTQDGADGLSCPRCGTRRPVVCAVCGRTRLRNLRRGVSRVREDLELLLGESVGEVTAGAGDASERVVIGTEAVLHGKVRSNLVAFLDFDQELLAPRYRAGEEALVLLARAGRAVGGRRRGAGRVVVQTSVPQHPVLAAAALGDPERFAEAEAQRRAELGWPPASAMAVISGEASEAFMDSFGSPLGVDLLGPLEQRWLLRAESHEVLCDALAATPRPRGRLRIEVDPLRV